VIAVTVVVVAPGMIVVVAREPGVVFAVIAAGATVVAAVMAVMVVVRAPGQDRQRDRRGAREFQEKTHRASV
jgi:hypothetical protein